MRVEYVNSFIRAVKSIVQDKLNVQIEMCKPVNGSQGKLCKQAMVLDVAVVIGVTRDIRGQVILSMRKDTSFKLASILMCGYEVKELDEMVMSVLGEVGNWVLGNSTIYLEQQKIMVDITPPNILCGNNMVISAVKGECITIPFKTSIGDLILDIAAES